MVHLVLAVLVLFVSMFPRQLLAIENASWGEIKTLVVDNGLTPAGKLVVTSNKVAGTRERITIDEYTPIPTAFGFWVFNKDGSIFEETQDGETLEWLDFIPSISGRGSLIRDNRYDVRISMRVSFNKEFESDEFKGTFPSLYYRVVLIRYYSAQGIQDTLGEWNSVPINLGRANKFKFQIGQPVISNFGD